MAVLASVVLTACGQDNGVGVSAEQGNSLDQSSKNGLTRSRELSVGSNAKSTVEMPTAALIVEAADSMFANQRKTQKDIADLFAQYYDKDEWSPVAVYFSAPDESDWSKHRDRIDEAIRTTPTYAPYLSGQRICVDKYIAGDAVAGAACFEHYWMVMNTAASIGLANQPLRGWPVDPSSKKGVTYSLAAATHAEFANLIETDIASRLKGRVLRDPSEAKAEIVKILYSYDSETLRQIGKEARTVVANGVGNSFQFDFTGVKGLAFLVGNIHYQNTGKGWEILKNGVTWFGDGKLSGKAYELSLESSISTNMTKSQSIENSSTGSTTNSSKATAGVK